MTTNSKTELLRQLKASMDKFILLNEEEFEQFASKFTFRVLRKKELFLREGEICRSVVFINQGCLRYFYEVEGEERTGQFFFENGWYTDYESLLTETPTKQNIEALELSQLLVLKKTDLDELYNQLPKVERFGRIMAENAYLGNRRNSIAFLTETPEKRYLSLLKERPKLFQRVPQHYIASFLGMKPQSLSRIRKRLADSEQNHALE